MQTHQMLFFKGARLSFLVWGEVAMTL
jgi:hypothetical protein